MHIAFVDSEKSPVHSCKAMTWAELSVGLSKPVVSPVKEGTGWMPALIEPGARRGERVQSVSALVLDIEATTSKDQLTGIKTITGTEPPDFADMCFVLALSGHACILHTSYSHDVLHPRYRLVLALSRPLLTKEEIKQLGIHVAGLFGLDTCTDTGCLEPARIFFLPRCPAERLDQFRHEVIEGEPLDVDAMLGEIRRAEAALTQATQKKRPKKTGEALSSGGGADAGGDAFANLKSPLDGWELDRVVEEVLVHLDPDMGYGEWLKVGAALHHQSTGDPDWLDAWDNWSSGSGKWVTGYCAEKWESFSQQRSTGRGAVTLASLLHMTKDKRNVAPHSKDLTVYSVQQLLAMPPLTWLVKGVIPDVGMGVLYGDSGAGKTFVAVDLALAISQGLDWQGCRVKKPTGVLYVSAEGGGGMGKRLKAYSKYHNVDLSDTPMGIVIVGLNLPEGDADRVIDACARMKERGYPTRFIVMDTLNRTIGGADENSSQDMGKYIDAINRIGNATGAFTLIVHHTGKDASKGARGHSSLRAAVDTEMSIKADGPIQVLTITKSRDGETGKPYAFKREVIQLGLDDDLDPITSCVALPADINLAMSLKHKPQGKWQKLVFNVFQDQNSKYTTPELLQAVGVAQPPRARWRDASQRAIHDLLLKGVLKKEGNILSIA